MPQSKRRQKTKNLANKKDDILKLLNEEEECSKSLEGQKLKLVFFNDGDAISIMENVSSVNAVAAKVNIFEDNDSTANQQAWDEKGNNLEKSLCLDQNSSVDVHDLVSKFSHFEESSLSPVIKDNSRTPAYHLVFGKEEKEIVDIDDGAFLLSQSDQNLVYCLRELRKSKGLDEKEEYNKKIIYYLNLPTLSEVDIGILRNVIALKVKSMDHDEMVETGEVVRKVHFAGMKKRNEVAKSVDIECQSYKEKYDSSLTNDEVQSHNVKSAQEVVSSDVKNEVIPNLAASNDPAEENDLRDECMPNQVALMETDMVQTTVLGDRFVQEKMLTSENESRKNPLDEYEPNLNQITPSKRMRMEQGTSDELYKEVETDEKELRRFSTAMHLWSEEEYGSSKALLEITLKDDDFRALIAFAGPGTKYDLLKYNSVPYYECLWRNSDGSSKSFRGHPMTGFETDEKLHSSARTFCPFMHCSRGLDSPLSPLDIDIMLESPRKVQISKKCNQLADTSRNLFPASASTPDEVDAVVEDMEVPPEEQVNDSEIINDEGVNFKVPSVDELLKKRKIILEQLKAVDDVLATAKKEEVKKTRSFLTITHELFKCKLCNAEVTTKSGLLKHHSKNHPSIEFEDEALQCHVCGIWSYWLDKHMKRVHKHLMVPKPCPLCGKTFANMKEHRGTCQICPKCNKEYPRKDRAEDHVASCKGDAIQIEPLDLSPMKRRENRTDENEDSSEIIGGSSDSIERRSMQETEFGLNVVLPLASSIVTEAEIETDAALHEESPCFSFENDREEGYMSEDEVSDSTEFRTRRRKEKYTLEMKLREVDQMVDPRVEGDNAVLEGFEKYLLEEQQLAANTVSRYSSSIRYDLLSACHELFNPFDARHLLDYGTMKNCTFEGEERRISDPKEPLFLTPRILRQAVYKYKDSNMGHQRSSLVAATQKWMLFTELHFSNKQNLYGREILSKIIDYHQSVRSYIEASGIWKSCNLDRDQQLLDNKQIHDIEDPHKDARIHEGISLYFNCQERSDTIDDLVMYAQKDSPAPSVNDYLRLTKFVMGEAIVVSGWRPVVVYKMKNGDYASNEPGFCPEEITDGDSTVVKEKQGNSEILSRLNPNLPPTSKACVHQLESKTAVCPQQCENECKPSGVNIVCDWDKTSKVNGAHYIHLPKPLKDMFDLYSLIKAKFFKDKKIKDREEENWFDSSETPFFLNSVGAEFNNVDVSHLNEIIGEDVTSYNFRKNMISWTLNHKLEEIRNAESEVANHTLRVARKHYQLNRQLKAQTLGQRFVAEESIYPETIEKRINEGASLVKDIIVDREEKGKKNILFKMAKDKGVSREALLVRQALGTKRRVYVKDVKSFIEIIERLTGEKMSSLVDCYSAAASWRQYIVRTVCSSSGEDGELLRALWVKIYKGDLKNGVRDHRRLVQEKGWPRLPNTFVNSRDRNSFLAGNILRAVKKELRRTNVQDAC